MKTILVPTDFSKTSENAARYAIQLAAALKAQVLLINVYEMPVAPYEVSMGVIPQQDFKELFTSRLNSFAAKLQKHNAGKIPIKAVCTQGTVGQGIIDYSEKHKVDLIVMGTHGETAAYSRLFGNTTSYLVRKSCIPVLAVPQFARYRPIENVLVSVDQIDSFTDPIVYTLENLSKTFDAKLNMVKVFRLSEAMLYGTTIDGVNRIEEKLKDVPHEYSYEIMGKAVDGINKAARKSRADLIVLIAHKHDLVARIMKESTTRQVVETAKKPLLILPAGMNEKRKTTIFAETDSSQKQKV